MQLIYLLVIRKAVDNTVCDGYPVFSLLVFTREAQFN